MAAIGVEVGGSWFTASGLLSFFILLLLLSIFLTALCSDCGRRSFKLQEPEEKNPSSLIRVVKLEEVARENPMISEIQNDEKDFNLGEENTVSFTPWRSHLGAPQNHRDVQTNSSAAVMKMTSESETAGDVNDSDHIYHVIGGGHDANVSSPATNHEAGEEHSGARSAVAVEFSNHDRSSVYAQVSKKVKPTTPPVYTPEEVQVVEEESSPPLPDRKAEMEG
ncbi:hypothetical protein L3Q82_000025 [Scortum barcoo]|uniref:Uncharacterized protein n=1 Tax=Scortum barcoo TaxID=214431 RepID=A0ACB8XB46_9TELE|nr:hypothetical protein L3Q82_000025 [Scortum barcoo]